MAWEIERKFLVDQKAWSPCSPGIHLWQGYIAREPEGCVRVRIASELAFPTVKGPRAGIRRIEFEHLIPLAEAKLTLDRLCGDRIVEKTRHGKGVDDGRDRIARHRRELLAPPWAIREPWTTGATAIATSPGLHAGYGGSSRRD